MITSGETSLKHPSSSNAQRGQRRGGELATIHEGGARSYTKQGGAERGTTCDNTDSGAKVYTTQYKHFQMPWFSSSFLFMMGYPTLAIGLFGRYLWATTSSADL